MREALSRGIEHDTLAHSATSLLGLAHVAQGNIEDALGQLAAMTPSVSDPTFPCHAVDLRLAEALVVAGIKHATVVDYVDRVRTKAQAEQDRAVLERLERLRL